MALINTNPLPAVTPPPPLVMQAAAFRRRVQTQWTSTTTLFSELAQWIWADPTQAQAKFDAFGTNAGDLFRAAAAYAAMVQEYTGQAPPSPVPAGWSYTIDSYGAVTVIPPK